VPVVAAAVLFALAVPACEGGDDDSAPTASPQVTSVPTDLAAGAPSPTGAPPPLEQNGYRIAPAIPQAGFAEMLGFRAIPGDEGAAATVTKPGRIWRVDVEGGGEPELLADLSSLLIADPSREEGLLGLEFSPTFEQDGQAYVHYTAGNPRRGVISRFATADGVFDLASEEIILEVEQPFPNHNGGEIAFGPDGMLYISLGDGGDRFDPNGNGQNLSTLLGTLLRLDVSQGGSGYEVPSDNPFVDTAGARPEIYAYGLRNPWRFSFDRETGDLWVGDVGQNEWEEVDRAVAGGNYGWSVVEGPECLQSGCDQSAFEPPRASYPLEGGNQAVIGGYVYRGQRFPELLGWYLYGDFGSGRIWAANTRDASEPVLLATTGVPISSFGQLADGELVVLSFSGAVYTLERA